MPGPVQQGGEFAVAYQLIELMLAAFGDYRLEDVVDRARLRNDVRS